MASRTPERGHMNEVYVIVFVRGNLMVYLIIVSPMYVIGIDWGFSFDPYVNYAALVQEARRSGGPTGRFRNHEGF